MTQLLKTGEDTVPKQKEIQYEVMRKGKEWKRLTWDKGDALENREVVRRIQMLECPTCLCLSFSVLD